MTYDVHLYPPVVAIRCFKASRLKCMALLTVADATRTATLPLVTMVRYTGDERLAPSALMMNAVGREGAATVVVVEVTSDKTVVLLNTSEVTVVVVEAVVTVVVESVVCSVTVAEDVSVSVAAVSVAWAFEVAVASTVSGGMVRHRHALEILLAGWYFG